MSYDQDSNEFLATSAGGALRVMGLTILNTTGAGGASRVLGAIILNATDAGGALRVMGLTILNTTGAGGAGWWVVDWMVGGRW